MIGSGIEWGTRGAFEILNVHPLFVHFPIAFLTGALVFYALGVFLRKDQWLISGKWTLYFGTLSAAAAVWTGLQAAASVPHDAATHAILEIHESCGIAAAALALVLSAWVFFSKSNIPIKGKMFFLLGLVLLSGILIQGADLGGRMVFLHGVGVGQKSFLEADALEDEPHMHATAAHDHDGHHHDASHGDPSLD